MKKMMILLLVFSILLTSCASHKHIIGSGAQGGATVEKRQWYALWGLVPIGDVDSNEMAGGSANYEIETTHTGLDWIINFFTGVVSITSRTVIVTK